MTETTFTIRLDEDLKSAFADVAKSQDRTAAQLMRVLMRQAVKGVEDERSHDAWFRGEVEQALREADDPAVHRISGEDVVADWERRRADFLNPSDSSSR